MLRKAERVSTDAAANFEHASAVPAFKVRELWDVRFNEILSRSNFLKIFPGAHHLRRMENVAGTTVPVLFHFGQRHTTKGFHCFSFSYRLKDTSADQLSES